jgi:hypothetical protein
MLSSAEEAKEGEKLGRSVGRYEDNIEYIFNKWASRSSGRGVLWLRRVLCLLRTL